ncbi:hypothetical protein OPIT5_26235 [Opitutaceae bacterium TAV5]|nr:hypothetical protein OPIT5_26235 [Opitutaceae bacterium TAV5]
MIPFYSQRFFYAIVVPLVVVLLALAIAHRPLVRREADTDRQLAELKAALVNVGHGADPAELKRQADALARETAVLRDIAAEARSLDRAPLVRAHTDDSFQLIEFEQERAAATQAARAAAAKAGVKLADSAFDILSDASLSPPQPRRRWAQLELARIICDHAITAKVATYEALPVPATREMRLDAGGPLLAVEILFSARVTGKSDRVQAFIEQLALGTPAAKDEQKQKSADATDTATDDDGAAAGDDKGVAVPASDHRVLIEHLVLRKEGTAASDEASATVVVAGLLSGKTEN